MRILSYPSLKKLIISAIEPVIDSDTIRKDTDCEEKKKITFNSKKYKGL